MNSCFAKNKIKMGINFLLLLEAFHFFKFLLSLLNKVIYCRMETTIYASDQVRD